MRLTGHILQITPDKLDALQDRPKLVKALIFPKRELDTAKLVAVTHRIPEIAMRGENNASPTDSDELEKARAEIVLQIQAAGVKLPDEEPGEAGFCLDESWHILHYLITGKAREASLSPGNAILGGTPIGDDLGYGPARYLNPQQVGEVAGALSRINPEGLAERFDPDVMLEEKIYGLGAEEKFDMLEYYFAQLVRYYATAAERGNAMLIYIY